MPNHELAPGTWGRFTVTHLDDGRVDLLARYRRFEGGPVRRARVRAASKAAAEREMRERLRTLVAETTPGAPDGQPMTLARFAPLWAARRELEVEVGQLRSTTLAENIRLLHAVVLPALGDRLLSEITPKVVTEFYENMVRKHPPQARNAKGVLSGVMKYATSLGHVPFNPVREVASIRRPRKEIFAPGEEQLAYFRSKLVEYRETERPGPKPSMLLLDVFDLMLATGFRIGEVLGLRWDHDVVLDGPRPKVTVNGAIKEKGGPKRWEPHPKSEAGRRTVVLPEFAVAILMRRLVETPTGSEFVFSTRTGAPNGPQDVHRALRAVREEFGLPEEFVPHALRKNVGTAIADEQGIESAALFLGHERSRVTEQFYAKRGHDAPDARDLLQTQYERIVGKGDVAVSAKPADTEGQNHPESVDNGRAD